MEPLNKPQEATVESIQNTHNDPWSFSSWIPSAVSKDISDIFTTVKQESSSITSKIQSLASTVFQDNDENSEVQFEKGTLLYTLDSYAEKAESYLGNLSTGITQSVSGFINKAIVIIPPDSNPPTSKVYNDRQSALVAAMKINPTTYTTEYETSAFTRFPEYKSNFDISSKNTEIASILRNDTELNVLFKDMVPLQISFERFWLCYFFRVDEILIEEKSRQTLLKNAIDDEDDFKWDSDDEEVDNKQESKESIPNTNIELSSTPKTNETAEEKVLNIQPHETDSLAIEQNTLEKDESPIPKTEAEFDVVSKNSLENDDWE